MRGIAAGSIFLADSLYDTYGTAYSKIYEHMFPKKNNAIIPSTRL
jgi:hypothetical protein